MPKVVVVLNDYPDKRSLRDVIHYALDKSVCQGSYAVDWNSDMALEQMLLVKAAFHKEHNLQLKHFLITFASNEADLTDFDELMQLGFLTGQLFREYQMVYAVHWDSNHCHIHFVMNTTSFLDGHQYSDGLAMMNQLCALLRNRYPGYKVELLQTRKYSLSDPYTDDDFGKSKKLK